MNTSCMNITAPQLKSSVTTCKLTITNFSLDFLRPLNVSKIFPKKKKEPEVYAIHETLIGGSR